MTVLLGGHCCPCLCVLGIRSGLWHTTLLFWEHWGSQSPFPNLLMKQDLPHRPLGPFCTSFYPHPPWPGQPFLNQTALVLTKIPQDFCQWCALPSVQPLTQTFSIFLLFLYCHDYLSWEELNIWKQITVSDFLRHLWSDFVQSTLIYQVGFHV